MNEIILIENDKFNPTQPWFCHMHYGVIFKKYRQDSISQYKI